MDALEDKIKNAFSQISYGSNGGSILDSDVIYSLEIDQKTASVVLVISEENASIKDDTAKKVEEALKGFDEIDNVKIQIESSREDVMGKSQQNPANQANPGSPEQILHLQNYENVILVASGKGGVGKSTVAINLALALKELGKTVSLMDADVYGPSVPIMLGRRNETLELVGEKIKPLNQFGIEFMSVGNMVNEDQALIWRGPMTHQVIQQILRDADWSGGDYMIIDMPPGTGDVQLSIAQLTSAAGAVVVCTPQDVALLDARKAIAMFDKVNIPVLGIIENMSSFVCPKCGEETPIFSKGGAEKESEAQKVAFIGRVPIEMDIRLGSDNGDPVVNAMPDSKSAKTFMEMAEKLIKLVEE